MDPQDNKPPRAKPLDVTATAKRKRAPRVREETVEDRLIAKATLNIKGDTFHPEWNYTISPAVPS